MRIINYAGILILFTSCGKINPSARDSTPAVSAVIEKRDFKSELRHALRGGRNGTKGNYELKLAVLYAKSNQPDSAFYYIDQYMASGNSDNVFYEPGLYDLLNDSRWKVVEQKQFEKSLKQGHKHKNRDITLALWRMHITDQAFYDDLNYYNQHYGFENPMRDTILNKIEAMNKENLAKLIPILNTVTWPKISEYDSLASATAFLVIQHSNDSLQTKYLPIIESYCKAGEASWQNFCLMADRLLVAQGRPQLYGTQLYLDGSVCKIRKIEDSANVNKRRQEKGLVPLEVYLKEMTED